MSTSSRKTAIITGGTRGIGEAITKLLHSKGFNVVVTYGSPSSAEPAGKLVSTLGSSTALAVQSDASSLSSIDDLIKTTTEKFGNTIDAVIANAGIMPMKDIEHTTPEDFDAVMNVNVKGPYFLVQKLLPHFPTTGGRIILVSTTLTKASTVAPGYLLYNASKGAIEQMTRVLSKDLMRKGTTVNCVSPGPTATKLFLDGKPDQVIEMLKKGIPGGRLGEPEDIAGVVGFLVSEDAKWVTGQNLRVNGGMA